MFSLCADEGVHREASGPGERWASRVSCRPKHAGDTPQDDAGQREAAAIRVSELRPRPRPPRLGPGEGLQQQVLSDVSQGM